jgi:hypothetical protein
VERGFSGGVVVCAVAAVAIRVATTASRTAAARKADPPNPSTSLD